MYTMDDEKLDDAGRLGLSPPYAMAAPQARAPFFQSPTLARAQSRVAFFTVILPIAAFVYGMVHIAKFGISPFFLCLWAFMHLVGMTGISVGYHRLGSHRSFKGGSWVKRMFYIMGSLSAQGPVIYWVSNHRRHHDMCDKEGDVHSPYYAENGTRFLNALKGFFEAHTGWMFHSNPTNPLRYSKDLLKDKDATFVNRHYFAWILLGIVAPGLVSLLVFPTLKGFMLGALFGGFVRIFSVQHVTWLINSWTHMFGRRTYVTEDHSTNAFWLSVFTVGEAWHNNHHAFPFSARLGLKWWQIDIGWIVLSSMRLVGLVEDLKLPSAAAMASKRINVGKMSEQTHFA